VPGFPLDDFRDPVSAEEVLRWADSLPVVTGAYRPALKEEPRSGVVVFAAGPIGGGRR
jgi:hypothetical protein